MQRLPPSIRSYAYTDSTRFEGLCEGLEAAKMHTIAKTVREQRAGLIVPSHALYTQERLLAGRNDAFSPIYVTPKGEGVSRRMTVAGDMQAMKCSSRESTPAALYSSQYMIKQMAPAPPDSPARPRTATAAMTAHAWDEPLDNATLNQKLYERHRAAGNGWSIFPASGPPAAGLGGGKHIAPPPAAAAAPEILDVAAEQAAAGSEEAYAFGDLLKEAAALEAEMEAEAAAFQASEPPPQTPDSAAVDIADAEEEMTPPQDPFRLADAKPSWMGLHDYSKPILAAGQRPGSSSSRRALNMADASQFYEKAGQATDYSKPPVMPPPPRPMTAARQAMLNMNSSDIFNHTTRREEWSFGAPTNAPPERPMTSSKK